LQQKSGITLTSLERTHCLLTLLQGPALCQV